MSATAPDNAWYVFGVVDASAPGVSGVRLARRDDLAAVVAEVALAEFDEAALPERLDDREWLEQKVLAHEAVLREVSTRTTVVPFRFGAVYRSLEDVAGMLEHRHRELSAALEHVRGHVELGVKGWVDRDRLERSLQRSLPHAAGGESAPGRAYLERRQSERETAREASRLIAQIAKDAHERLVHRAADGVLNPPQPRELTGRDEEMFLNGAYLVCARDDSLVAEVGGLHERHRSAGIDFELTGPWPPYNFVRLEDGSP